MVILTDCPLFEPSCPGRIGWLTPRSLNVWSSLYHAEIHMDPFFADHRGQRRGFPGGIAGILARGEVAGNARMAPFRAYAICSTINTTNCATS